MKQSAWIVVLSAVTSWVFLTGCPPKKKLAIEEKAPEVVETVDESTQTLSSPNDIQIGQDWTEIPALQMVNFAYDSAMLDDMGRAALKNNVGLLKKLPSGVVARIEGHCDDRGTVEYNIALGQKRANAVQSYYVTSGISRSRIETISFGEERPLCTDATEGCWARNRRGVTKVKAAQSLSINPDTLK